MDIEKKIAIVSGGSSGMGAATAHFLKEHGATVVVWDKVLKRNGFDEVECDVTSANSVQTAMEQTIQKVGAPQICINCAGIAPAKRMVGKEGAMPLEFFSKVIEVNLIGTFNVMRVAAEQMIQLRKHDANGSRGIIINTASIAAYEGQIGQTAYSASKGGIVSMTLPAARELAQFDIRVNTIAPGLIATPLLANMPEDVQCTLAKSIPYPKRFGRPDEFALLVGHIIQNEMINGEVIRLDGALRMQPK